MPLVSKRTRRTTRLVLSSLPLDDKASVNRVRNALGIFVSVNELVLCLTKHQKSCTTS